MMSRQSLLVSHDHFVKAYKNYMADPSKDIRELFSGRNSVGENVTRVVISSIGGDGKEVTAKDMADSIEKAAKKQVKSNEDFIDLEFYPKIKK